MNDLGHAYLAEVGAPIFASPLARGTDIVGSSVFIGQNESLGRVEEVVIDNRIADAVLSFGGCFGLGKMHRAVPWQALLHECQRQVYVLNKTNAQVRREPRLTKMAAWHFASSHGLDSSGRYRSIYSRQRSFSPIHGRNIRCP